MAKNNELMVEMSSLKDLNQQLNTRLATQDNSGQEEPDGASSLNAHDQVK